MHPSLAISDDIQAYLSAALQSLRPTLQDASSFPSVQDQWEEVKTTLKRTIQQYCRQLARKRRRAEQKLQRQRNQLLRLWRRTPGSDPDPLLSTIEQEINRLQTVRVETLARRAGLRWREQGEISAGYLKRTIASRSTQQSIPAQRHPETNVLGPSVNHMQESARRFYHQLYHPDPVDHHAIQDLLDHLPADLHLCPPRSLLSMTSSTLSPALRVVVAQA